MGVLKIDEFSGADLLLIASPPVEVQVEERESHYFAENEELHIYASGETEAEAIREFNQDILHFYRHYRDLDEERVMGLGSRLKKRFSEVFSCASA